MGGDKGEVLRKSPFNDQLMELLKDVGAIYSPKELGVDRELFRDNLIVAKRYENAMALCSYWMI